MPTYEDMMEDEMMGEEMMGDEEQTPKLPVISLSSVHLPQVVDWEDGEEYELLIRVRQQNKREEDDLTTADFQILSVKAAPAETTETEEETFPEELAI
jgi:hypothetical protein